MFQSELTIVILMLSVYVGFKYSTVYVPDNFERPWFFRSISNVMELSANLARAAEFFNIGTEASNFRSIVNLFTGVFVSKNINVQVEVTEIKNVRVKIYRPISVSSEKLPAMVFYHGGGYTFGNIDSYDEYLFEFVVKLNMIVISVDYRMTPEYPYPTPTDECYTVTKYLIENAELLNVNSKRIVVAGDSAGGDAVAVVTQRLRKENIQQPKIQLLINPWVQKFMVGLPSEVKYKNTGAIGRTGIRFVKFISWYLGITNITQDIVDSFDRNEIIGLIEDKKKQQKILSFLDVSKIPEIYTKDRSYYQTYNKLAYPEQLPESSILRRDANVSSLFKKLLDPSLSPLLADDDDLKGLPKAYFIILEWDTFKDEGLLYAERLIQAGVNVKVAFYENAFHGIVNMIQPYIGYQIARDMQTDLLNYLSQNL